MKTKNVEVTVSVETRGLDGRVVTARAKNTWDLWLHADRKKPEIDREGFIIHEEAT